jgi:hypothetical protein
VLQQCFKGGGVGQGRQGRVAPWPVCQPGLQRCDGGCGLAGQCRAALLAMGQGFACTNFCLRRLLASLAGALLRCPRRADGVIEQRLGFAHRCAIEQRKAGRLLGEHVRVNGREGGLRACGGLLRLAGNGREAGQFDGHGGQAVLARGMARRFGVPVLCLLLAVLVKVRRTGQPCAAPAIARHEGGIEFVEQLSKAGLQKQQPACQRHVRSSGTGAGGGSAGERLLQARVFHGIAVAGCLGAVACLGGAQG